MVLIQKKPQHLRKLLKRATLWALPLSCCALFGWMLSSGRSAQSTYDLDVVVRDFERVLMLTDNRTDWEACEGQPTINPVFANQADWTIVVSTTIAFLDMFQNWW